MTLIEKLEAADARENILAAIDAGQDFDPINSEYVADGRKALDAYRKDI